MTTRVQQTADAIPGNTASPLGKRNRADYETTSDSISHVHAQHNAIASSSKHTEEFPAPSQINQIHELAVPSSSKRLKTDGTSVSLKSHTPEPANKPRPVHIRFNSDSTANEPHSELWKMPYTSAYRNQLAYGRSAEDAKTFLKVNNNRTLHDLRTQGQNTTAHDQNSVNQLATTLHVLLAGAKPNQAKPAVAILKNFLATKTPRLEPQHLKALDPIINRNQLPYLHDIVHADAKSLDYSIHRFTHPHDDVRSIQNTHGYMAHLPPNSKVTYAGYTFHTDELARPVKVTGSVGHAQNHLDSWDHKLDVGWSSRIRRGTGLASMQGYDYGMHLVPNGPHGFVNLAALNQDLSSKGGEWEMLQRLWTNEAANGKYVKVDIALKYPETSHRPETLHARYTIAGDEYATSIANRSTSQFFRSPTSLQHFHAQGNNEKVIASRSRIGDAESKYVISDQPELLVIRKARQDFHSLLTGVAKQYGLPVDPTRQFLANPHGELAESTYKAYFSGLLPKDRLTNLHRVIHTEPERLPVAFENLLNVRTRDLPERTHYSDYNLPNTTYKYRNLTFKTDALGRPASVSGLIFHTPQQIREENEQKAIGWSERVRYDKKTKEPGDHGGHLVARSLGGPPEAYNLVAQNAMMNAEPKSEWFEMERFWKDATSKEKHVGVHIMPEFEGLSQRPHAIQVQYQIDNEFFRSRIPNPKGRLNPQDLHFDAASIYAHHVVPMSFNA